MAKCKKCDSCCVKNGRQANGTQRFYCKNCRHSFQVKYRSKAYCSNINEQLVALLKEGNGIRGISRLLKISTNTVIHRVLGIASRVEKPFLSFGKEYEMDEMCTYVSHKNRRIWIAYAIRKDTREVVDFRVGRRTNKTLSCLRRELLIVGGFLLLMKSLIQKQF